MSEIKQTLDIPKATSDTTPQLVSYKDLYEKLCKPISPEDIIVYREDNKEFHGYNAQVAINRLNEIVGIENWTVESSICHEEFVKGAWAVAMEVDIIIKIEDTEIRRTGSGGAYASRIENAYKGARTSAFKNACKYLGIGKELYNQKADDDIIYEEVEEIESSDIAKLHQKIDDVKTKEELQELELAVKQVTDKKYQAIIIKAYNKKKIELMTK